MELKCLRESNQVAVIPSSLGKVIMEEKVGREYVLLREGIAFSRQDIFVLQNERYQSKN